MLQLTSRGLAGRGQLDGLRDRFMAQHCLVLENLLDAALLAKIQHRLAAALWRPSAFADDGFRGTELTLDDALSAHLLGFVLNNPGFLNAIRIITGCPEISEFIGRVYRMVAGADHELSWHNDIDPEQNRLVGFSLNLSTSDFRGGDFELRDRPTQAPLARLSNTGSGDALLFRIAANLEHRVTRVVGASSKTACAGWFCATGRSYFAELLGGTLPGRAVSTDS